MKSLQKMRLPFLITDSLNIYNHIYSFNCWHHASHISFMNFSFTYLFGILVWLDSSTFYNYHRAVWYHFSVNSYTMEQCGSIPRSTATIEQCGRIPPSTATTEQCGRINPYTATIEQCGSIACLLLPCRERCGSNHPFAFYYARYENFSRLCEHLACMLEAPYIRHLTHLNR